MQQRTVFGRNERELRRHGLEGCGYIGKIVSYPAGKYQEMGEVYLDLANPHCYLVLGKRGTGKSYTLGVLAEAFGSLRPEHRRRLSVVVVDTMSVFHCLKAENSNPVEVERLKEFKGLVPGGMDGYVSVLMPKLALEALEGSGREVACDGLLQLGLREVEVNDWLALLGLSMTDPVGTLLARVVRVLGQRGEPYGFEEMYRVIQKETAQSLYKESLTGMLQMVQDLKVFGREGTPISDIVAPGKLTVLDISYLGRLGGIDVRTLLVSIIGRRLMRERTLYTTVEMQAEAGLIDEDVAKDITKEHPLVYMMLDEAHLFLPSSGKTLATDTLIDWIKLGRHPGLSLVLATQEPSALHPSAIKQADLIIAHNVTAKADLDALKVAKQSYASGGQDFDRLIADMEFKRGLAVVMDDKTRRQELVMIRPRLTLHTGVDASLMPR